jgi:hypothetical protein
MPVPQAIRAAAVAELFLQQGRLSSPERPAIGGSRTPAARHLPVEVPLMHRIPRIGGPLMAALLLSTLAPAVFADSPAISRQHFQDDMRKLWEDHVTWTRLYIVSALGSLPDKEATAGRLLQNQKDIGDAIKPFYGDVAGDKLAGLLRDHILIAADLIDAAQHGDATKQADATRRWSANADDIAAFLSGANPKNWSLADAKAMMHEHLDLTTEEVVAQLKKDWTASISAYDDIHIQILKMADMLSSGIEKQFPSKFRA